MSRNGQHRKPGLEELRVDGGRLLGRCRALVKRIECLFPLRGRWLGYFVIAVGTAGAGLLTARASYGATLPMLVFVFAVPAVGAHYAPRPVLGAVLASSLYMVATAQGAGFFEGLYRSYVDGVWRIPPSEPQSWGFQLVVCWGIALAMGISVARGRQLPIGGE